MTVQIRDLPDEYFGGHDEERDPDCVGTRCPTCGCCLHCSESDCKCPEPSCGCHDDE